MVSSLRNLLLNLENEDKWFCFSDFNSKYTRSLHLQATFLLHNRDRKFVVIFRRLLIGLWIETFSHTGPMKLFRPCNKRPAFMTVLFCLLLPEVHFICTQFREWALLPSLGVRLLSECVVDWKCRPKLLMRSQRLIHYCLLCFLPSLCNVECVFFSLAAEFKIHVTWSTTNLFASITD
jgi:hypothetical protein